MSSWTNAYSAPEKFELELVGEVSLNDDAYQFDLIAVWWSRYRRAFLVAEDAGCSCPSPFEDYDTGEALHALQPLDLAGLTAKLRALEPNSYGYVDEPVSVQVARVLDRAREVTTR